MAGSKTSSYETSVLELVFHNVVGTALAGVGTGADITATGTAGSLYISLHTADPTEAGLHTGEIVTGDYAEYARKAVARAPGSWMITGASPTQIVNAAAVTYIESTGPGSPAAAWFGVNKSLAGTGTGEMLYYGSLQSSLTINSGVQPDFSAGSLIIKEG